jgi:hypothetical protein
VRWHASADLLTRFARAPEALDPTTAASVEAHLLGCVACRRAVAAAADPEEVAASWRSIVDVIDRPRERLGARFLRRFGVPIETTRLVAATRPLVVGWLAAVVGSMALAVVLSRIVGSPGPFLVIAPVVPALVVWLAFAPIADPAGEAGVATPLAGAGLVLRRLVAVEVPAAVALAAGAAAVPHAGHAAVAWLLPGLALAAGGLALGTSVRIVTAAGLATLGWTVLLGVDAALDRHPLAQSVLFALPGQVVALGLAAAAVAICWRRRDRFATLAVTW